LQACDVEYRGDRRQSASTQEHMTYVGAVSAAAHSDSAVTARRINMIHEELWLMLCKIFRKKRYCGKNWGVAPDEGLKNVQCAK
jgi:hypothetical protein